jgi:5-methylcytosine-specific restriction endonuclease McrA
MFALRRAAEIESILAFPTCPHYYGRIVPKPPALGQIHEQMLALLKEHPEGLSEGEMRAALRLSSEEQVQFGRRRRDLHYYHRIAKKRIGKKVVYIYVGPREQPLDAAPISGKLRAQAIHAAHARCGMCGRTIEKHGIALVVDHKIPREWGGKTEPDNLWAICEECNHGKKNLFASVDSSAMRSAIKHDSVHVRIGELLKAAGVGVPVPSTWLDIAANQDEWRKRLRELRYLGWVIKASRAGVPGGRFQSAYMLEKFTEWPPDPTSWIANYERERAKRNKQKRA